MTGRCEAKSPDAEGQRPVDSSKVLERENPDQTRPVNVDRTLIRFQLLTGCCSASDRTLKVQHPVDISKVPIMENVTGHVWSVLIGRCQRPVNT